MFCNVNVCCALIKTHATPAPDEHAIAGSLTRMGACPSPFDTGVPEMHETLGLGGAGKALP